MASRNTSMRLRKRSSKEKNAAIIKLLKDNQCRECAVVITRMDFAKILGKHKKVKIQFENLPPTVTPTRLKRNENGMVHIPRSAYSEHPAKDILKPRKKSLDCKSHRNSAQEKKQVKAQPKPKPLKAKKNESIEKPLKAIKKESYYISFNTNHRSTKDKEIKIKLLDVLPNVNKSILPNENWTMHYLPDIGEPMNDKVYDKIAAELEDLMNSDSSKVTKSHSDDLPSIMDILNDNTKNITTEVKSELASSDIEAMLMGSSSPVHAHRSDTSQDSNIASLSSDEKTSQDTSGHPNIDEPGSPSIFDHSSNQNPKTECKPVNICNGVSTANEETKEMYKSVTHLIFQQFKDNTCLKTVTIPRNLKYKVEIGGKLVELIAAPKTVESRNQISNLLQILNFTDPSSDYLEVL